VRLGEDVRTPVPSRQRMKSISVAVGSNPTRMILVMLPPPPVLLRGGCVGPSATYSAIRMLELGASSNWAIGTTRSKNQTYVRDSPVEHMFASLSTKHLAARIDNPARLPTTSQRRGRVRHLTAPWSLEGRRHGVPTR
jgi:hypothetical protein